MIVMCAWCQSQGRPAMLGEKEPRDSVAVSHGICDEHALLMLTQARRSRERASEVADRVAPPIPESKRSPDAPVRRRRPLLIIVSRTAPGRLTYLEHKLGDDVEVIADRRVGQRRRKRAMTTIERRSAERRRWDVSAALQNYGWTSVTR
jgi:hypothetical protein